MLRFCSEPGLDLGKADCFDHAGSAAIGVVFVAQHCARISRFSPDLARTDRPGTSRVPRALLDMLRMLRLSTTITLWLLVRSVAALRIASSRRRTRWRT